MKRIGFGESIKHSAWVAIVVLVSQACATGPGAPAATPTAATQSPAPSQIETSPTPSTYPSTVAVEVLADSGTMFPGTYRTAFEPALTLTINDLVDLDCAPGYRCRGDIDVNLPRWVGFEFGNVHGCELDVMRLDHVYTNPASNKLVDPPADLAGWFAKQPGVTMLGDPTPVIVGGVSGVRLEFKTDRNVRYGPTGIPDPPDFGVGPSARVSLIVLRVNGHWVLIGEFLGPDNTVHDFDAALRGLQPIVDSIVWG